MAGTGVPGWVEPQLATLTKDRFSDPAWIYERKLDGERILAFCGGGGVRLRTRRQRDVTATFPEIVAALAVQRAEGCVADGEVVAFADGQPRFAQLQQRLGQAHPMPDLLRRYPVFYYAFDLLFVGGRDIRAMPQRDRKRLLGQTLSFDDPLRYTEHRDGDGEALWRQACRDGWEGLIAKRADAAYEGGRTRNWLKFKCVNAQELVIGGYTDPKGSRQWLGAILVGYHDPDGGFRYAGKVGTGFSAGTLRDLHAALSRLERDTPPFQRGKPPRPGTHWTEPRLVAQIGFVEWTSDGLLRQPRFEGLRDDKDPTEVVRETPR
jgi:bifunctional non-homologous end joining protein LigD